MSLKVWLPLNGDLTQQGASEIAIINNGATVNNNGKIGNCYYFNASSYLYENTYNWTNFNTSQFSLCCWYKEPSPVASGNSQIICIGTSSGWNNIRIGLLRRTSNGYPMFSVSNGSSAVQYSFTANSFVLDQWNHIVCTYNNGELKMYLNGVLHKTSTTTITPILNTSQHLGIGAASNGAEKLTGYLNDVRIYDHCLSAAEVREISQGLVLHYKLDSPYNEFSQNLCTAVRPGTGTNITWGGHVAQWTNYDATNDPVPFNEGTKGEIVYGSNGSTGGGASRSICTIAASPSTTYTYSCYIKASDNLAYTHANFLYKYEYTAVSGGTKITEAGYFNNARKELLSNGWYRIWGTFTTRDTTNGINISFYTYPGKNVTYWLGGWQIEQKDHVTPFMSPGTSRNNTIIQDSSGYGHHGIINDTTLKSTSDTSRYSAALQNAQAANSATFPFKGEVNMPESSALTFSWWMKPTTWGTQISGIFSTSALDSPTDYSTTTANMRDSCFDCCNTSGTCVRINVASHLTLNEWHYYTLTYNGAQLNFYKDGISKVTASQTGSLKAFKNIFPFFSKAGGANRCTSGSLSDFRIYATALDADAIHQLYEVGAKIDNKQNLHTFELAEINSGRELLGSTYITPSYSNHTAVWTNYDTNGEITLINNVSLGSPYIKVNPEGKKYYFDADISVDANNQVYIGFQRYDAGKTSRSNDATTYVINIKPTTALVHQHYHGIYDATSTKPNFGWFDANTPVDTISLRILNDWSGANNRKLIVHRISLREISSLDITKINKQGQTIADNFTELDGNCRIQKNGTIESNEFIEF